MTVVFFFLITVACIILSFLVLIQNPKGGGLAGSIGGFNNQFMGVKQTNDVLEKGTWLFASVIGVLCIVSTVFFKGAPTGVNPGDLPNAPHSTNAPAQTPNAPTAPIQQTPH